MDAGALSKAMGGALSLARYEALLPAFNAAMVAAGITTPLRAAHWCSQLGHKSGGVGWRRAHPMPLQMAAVAATVGWAATSPVLPVIAVRSGSCQAHRTWRGKAPSLTARG